MDALELYHKNSISCSKITTQNYSTSFSLGILSLGKKYRNPIYSIYGFVRFADEIVDTFHQCNKEELLDRFYEDTQQAIEEKISLNPILNSFQLVVNQYQIEWELIEQFMSSMRMDLNEKEYTETEYNTYILGSAEVVGLMCLRVFTNGDTSYYLKLKPQAMKLGAAFQKINFLRDLKADYHTLGRAYFPNFDLKQFDENKKQEIEADIELDFKSGLAGIKLLPRNARFGVYVAYTYYYALFNKIKGIKAQRLLNERMRVNNLSKYMLIFQSYIRHILNWL